MICASFAQVRSWQPSFRSCISNLSTARDVGSQWDLMVLWLIVLNLSSQVLNPLFKVLGYFIELSVVQGGWRGILVVLKVCANYFSIVLLNKVTDWNCV